MTRLLPAAVSTYLEQWVVHGQQKTCARRRGILVSPRLYNYVLCALLDNRQRCYKASALALLPRPLVASDLTLSLSIFCSKYISFMSREERWGIPVSWLSLGGTVQGDLLICSRNHQYYPLNLNNKKHHCWPPPTP